MAIFNFINLYNCIFTSLQMRDLEIGISPLRLTTYYRQVSQIEPGSNLLSYEQFKLWIHTIYVRTQ